MKAKTLRPRLADGAPRKLGGPHRRHAEARNASVPANVVNSVLMLFLAFSPIGAFLVLSAMAARGRFDEPGEGLLAFLGFLTVFAVLFAKISYILHRQRE